MPVLKAGRHLSGYKKDRPDPNDKVLASVDVSGLPKAAAINDSMIPIFDQLQQGSCTGNGGCFQAAWLEHQAGHTKTFSRQFLYNVTRILENMLSEDSGCEPRDVFRALAKYGVCEESFFPYDENKLTVTPPKAAYDAALAHKALMYFRCASLSTIKQSIVDGFPVGFGFQVYESFMSDEVARTGLAPMPTRGEAQDGGHYVVCTGYDDTKKIGNMIGACKVRNSWGSNFGQAGYFWLPYGYWQQGLASDNWTLRRKML